MNAKIKKQGKKADEKSNLGSWRGGGGCSVWRHCSANPLQDIQNFGDEHTCLIDGVCYEASVDVSDWHVDIWPCVDLQRMAAHQNLR